VSRRAEDLLGYPVEEWLGDPGFWQRIIHPEDRDRAVQTCKSATEQGQDHDFEYRAIAQDGRVVWLHDLVRVTAGPDGHPQRLRGLMVDITQRKLIEQELDTRVRQQRAVSQLGLRALAGESLDELLHEAARIIADVLQVEGSRIQQFLPEENTLLLRAGMGWNGRVGRLRTGMGSGAFPKNLPFLNEPIITEDVRTQPVLMAAPWLKEEGVLSSISVVMPGSRHPWGLLGADSRSRRAFSRDDGHFLESVANLLAAAFERHEAATRLHESEERFRDLYNQAPVAFHEIDRAGVIRRVNRAECDLLGFEASQMLGWKVWEFVAPEEQPASIEAVKQKLSGDRPLAPFHREYVRRDGSTVMVEVHENLIRGADGQIDGLRSVLLDVTESRRAERALRESQERFELVARATNDAVRDWDLITDHVWWNEGVCSLFGYSAGEIGKDASWWYERVHEEDQEGLLRGIGDLIDRGGQRWEGHYRFRRADGTYAHVFDRGYVMRDESGKAFRMIGAMLDVSRQKTLEAELRRKNEELEQQNSKVRDASRHKSEFLANMSHELRTPLNGIIGFTELMHSEITGPVSAAQKEYLGDVLTSAKHLLHLINDILDLAKVEAGRMHFRSETVDLDGLVREAVDVVHPLAAQKQIQVSIDVDRAVASIVTDPLKYQQVLYNFLSNALKFTPEGGRVAVRVFPSGSDAFRTEVEDSGIGIRPEDLSRIFVEFEQLDAGVSKKYPGTGLGLTLTRRIVEAQGGNVGVQSKIGEGSVFYAVLPRKAPEKPGE
ncbi:MAG: PAS domain-containing protein, partial [Bryobacteraceae bacterium]